MRALRVWLWFSLLDKCLLLGVASVFTCVCLTSGICCAALILSSRRNGTTCKFLRALTSPTRPWPRVINRSDRVSTRRKILLPYRHASRMILKLARLILMRLVIEFDHLTLVLFSFVEIPAESLRGRVFEISLGDLNQNAHDQAWRKVRVQCEEVKGYDCYTNFYGLDITRDKLCTLVKKWHTLIEAFAQAKTSDGYHLRMFCIAFTRRNKRQVKATCYAKNSQQKLIRQKMMEIMVSECQKSTLKDLFKNM